MKNFISFVIGIITGLIGLAVAAIFGLKKVHKTGLEQNGDYKKAHDRHVKDFCERLSMFIASISDDFIDGLMYGRKYNAYSDKWEIPPKPKREPFIKYNTYKKKSSEFKTLIMLKNVTDPKEADLIEAHIYDKGLYFDWCDYNHDGKYSFVCYDDELDLIEEYLTNAAIDFDETDADILDISKTEKSAEG